MRSIQFRSSIMGRTRRSLHFVGAVIEWISSVSGTLGAVVIAMMASVVFYAVIMRYIFKNAPHWEINWAAYSMLFLCLVPAAYVLRKGGHITVDVIYEKLPVKARGVLEIAASIISLGFCLGFFVAGWNLVSLYHSTGHVSQDALKFPIYVIQIFIPVAAGLLSLQYLVKLARDIKAMRLGVETEDMKLQSAITREV